MTTVETKDTELNVLLLEDNAREAVLVQQTLESGWKADVTIHRYLKVQDTVSHLNHSTPDIILLDLNVLDSEGLNTVETVVKGNHAQVPIVVTTSMKDQNKAIQALEIGAQEYVVKGEYSAESLTTAIRFARARTSAQRQTPVVQGEEGFKLDGFAVDLMEQAIVFSKDGSQQKVALTPMEIKLMAYFIKNEGRQLSREELRDKVWGEDVTISDRVIDNQVSRLRSKIKFSKYSVQSVRSIGYRFEKIDQ